MNHVQRFLPTTLALATFMAVNLNAQAGELSHWGSLSQSEFLAVSKDLAAVTSTKAIEPAAPLGLSGFDVSASSTMTRIQEGDAWRKASGDSQSYLTQTKLSVSKGLSNGWDVGGFVATVPSTSMSVTGVHAKYALLEGNAIAPALAVRGSYSHVGGVSGLALNNTGVDVLMSKGFVGVTPYLGLGTVYTRANATSQNDENFRQRKSFVGVSWNVLLVNLSAEYDRTGDNASFGLKAGVRF